MQEKTIEGKYLEPEELDVWKMMEELSKPSPNRFIVFKGHDLEGRPTKEQRRAWRRYKRTNK